MRSACWQVLQRRNHRSDTMGPPMRLPSDWIPTDLQPQIPKVEWSVASALPCLCVGEHVPGWPAQQPQAGSEDGLRQRHHTAALRCTAVTPTVDGNSMDKSSSCTRRSVWWTSPCASDCNLPGHLRCLLPLLACRNAVPVLQHESNVLATGRPYESKELKISEGARKVWCETSSETARPTACQLAYTAPRLSSLNVACHAAHPATASQHHTATSSAEKQTIEHVQSRALDKLLKATSLSLYPIKASSPLVNVPTHHGAIVS